MDPLWAGLLALVTALAGGAVALGALNMVRAGVTRMSANGNPRNRAQAHDSMIDVGIGIVMVVGATAIATFLYNTLHF